MSIQSNFPTAKPSLLLDFANTKQLDPRITFTRASTANYYDGKTATKAEENLLKYSQDLDNSSVWSYFDASVTANSTTAPDGTTTADTLTAAATNAAHGRYQDASVVSGLTYTMSMYVKIGTARFFQLAQYSAPFGSTAYANFDISNGVVTTTGAGTTAAITYSGNGWYRCSITNTCSSSGTGGWFGMIVISGASARQESFNAAGTETMYLWGAQFEQRSTVSTYTATTSVPITNYIPTLQSAASGVARFDSNPTTGESLGLLIEESRTNLLLASAQFETPSWVQSNATIVGNIDVGPDGAFTADKLIESATTTNYHLIYQTISSTSAQSYTASIYAKASERSWISVRIYDVAAGTGYAASFNLSTGVVGTVDSGNTASITSVGNGWYRCSVTRTLGASGATVQLIVTNADALPSYAGNGYSGIYIWGSQFEVGSSATSYVATPLTFTSRASSATYLGSNGYITSATTNTARNQTNSVGTTNLLLESAASNALTYTDDLANSVWSKTAATVAINAIQAPDGLVFADKLCEDSSNYYHYFERTGTTGTLQTFSFYAKAAERTKIWVQLGASQVYFDLSAGTVIGGTGVITDAGGGWYRCSTSTTPSTTALQVGLYTTSSSYAGTAGYGAYFWGFQVEAGSTATSYIPSVETWSSRASVAKYYNSSGVLTSAASGASRTTYNPALLGAGGKLLLEPAATNLALYSEQFENWTNAIGTLTTNTTTAPDGATTADTLTGVRFRAPALGSNTYSFSCYCKKVDGDGTVRLRVDNPSNFGSVFDLNTGTVTSNDTGIVGSIQAINNGWYRCTIVFTYSITNIVITSANNGSNSTYIWGGQLETGSGATSYITTTTASVTRVADASSSAAQSRSADVYSASTVTRAADAASMTGTNFSSWYRQDEGTMFADATMSPTANGRVVQIGISGFSYLSMIGIVSNSTATSVQASLINLPGGDAFDLATTTYARGTAFKGAVAYKNGSIAATFNGATPATSSSTTAIYTSMTTIGIGQGDSGSYLNGTIKKLAYYPNRLTNANIQAITT